MLDGKEAYELVCEAIDRIDRKDKFNEFKTICFLLVIFYKMINKISYANGCFIGFIWFSHKILVVNLPYHFIALFELSYGHIKFTIKFEMFLIKKYRKILTTL